MGEMFVMMIKKGTLENIIVEQERLQDMWDRALRVGVCPVCRTPNSVGTDNGKPFCINCKSPLQVRPKNWTDKEKS